MAPTTPSKAGSKARRLTLSLTVAAVALLLSSAVALAEINIGTDGPETFRGTKPDLSIAMIGPSQLFVGETDYYRIVVTNEGPGSVTVPADNVLVNVTLTGSTFSSAGGFAPYTPSFSGDLKTVRFATPVDDTIRAGKTRAFDVRPRSSSAAGTTAITAQVDPDGVITEANEANNTAPTFTTNVVARPTTDPTVNLGTSISDQPDPVRVGRVLTYTLEVTNNGPDALPPGALIRDTLSNKVKLRSVEFTQGSGECVFMRFTDRQLLECRTSGAIGVGETTVLNIVVFPKREGRLETSASAEGGGEFVVHPDGIPTVTERTKVVSSR